MINRPAKTWLLRKGGHLFSGQVASVLKLVLGEGWSDEVQRIKD